MEDNEGNGISVPFVRLLFIMAIIIGIVAWFVPAINNASLQFNNMTLDNMLSWLSGHGYAALADTQNNLTTQNIDAAAANTYTIGATNPYSNVKAQTFTSTVAGGTPPLTVTSTTKVTNLNADLLDGQDWSGPTITSPNLTGTVTGNIGRSSSIYIAAPDSSAASKAQATYVVTNVNDQITFATALAAAGNSEVSVAAGTYHFSGLLNYESSSGYAWKGIRWEPGAVIIMDANVGALAIGTNAYSRGPVVIITATVLGYSDNVVTLYGPNAEITGPADLQGSAGIGTGTGVAMYELRGDRAPIYMKADVLTSGYENAGVVSSNGTQSVNMNTMKIQAYHPVHPLKEIVGVPSLHGNRYDIVYQAGTVADRDAILAGNLGELTMSTYDFTGTTALTINSGATYWRIHLIGADDQVSTVSDSGVFTEIDFPNGNDRLGRVAIGYWNSLMDASYTRPGTYTTQYFSGNDTAYMWVNDNATLRTLNLGKTSKSFSYYYANPSTNYTGWQVYNGASPGVWGDLDLSSVVGANTALVTLRINAGTSDGYGVALREKGDTAEYDLTNVFGTNIGYVSGNKSTQLAVQTDTSGVIQWKTSASTANCTVDVVSYMK